MTYVCDGVQLGDVIAKVFQYHVPSDFKLRRYVHTCHLPMCHTLATRCNSSTKPPNFHDALFENYIPLEFLY